MDIALIIVNYPLYWKLYIPPVACRIGKVCKAVAIIQRSAGSSLSYSLPEFTESSAINSVVKCTDARKAIKGKSN